jgi:hypothetical protein
MVEMTDEESLKGDVRLSEVSKNNKLSELPVVFWVYPPSDAYMYAPVLSALKSHNRE